MESVSGGAEVVMERARRLGPLPYSASGSYAAPVLPCEPALVDWEVEILDACWNEFRRPDPFALVEVGAGDGVRAAALLGRGPECLSALRYVLVEDDPGRRNRQSSHLPIESPILVLGPVDSDDDDLPSPVAGIGPLVTSLPELPVVDGAALVVTLGWLSRLPSDRLEWRDGRWWEIRLAAFSDGLRELPVPLDGERTRAAEALTGDHARPDGARFALLGLAVDWLASVPRVAEAGWLAVVDRWTALTAPLPPGEVPPLALDQLATVRRPVEAAPVELFSGLSVVTWRLG